MKGVIFTEFLEMVESAFSPAMADRIIEKAELPSGGAYTAVGTYPATEMVALVSNLSEETKVPVPDLLRAYGRHLFSRFAVLYPNFFEGETCPFKFLGSVETYIHTEVRKLYPDAEMPVLDCEEPEPGRMVVSYQSARGLADVAHGLIEGCFAHFGREVSISRQDLSGGHNTDVRFQLQV